MVRIPRTREDALLVLRTTRLVLSVPTYATVAVVATWVSLTAFVLAQNVALVRDLVIGGSLPLADRLVLVREQYPFLGTNYDTVTGIAVLIVAILIGVNLTLVAYHLREHELGASGGGGSVFGVVLGVLGAGCATCGSALLLGLLSLVGASGLLLALPLGGLELSLLAIGAVLLSTFWLAEGLRGGEVRGCPVESR